MKGKVTVPAEIRLSVNQCVSALSGLHTFYLPVIYFFFAPSLPQTEYSQRPFNLPTPTPSPFSRTHTHVHTQSKASNNPRNQR